MNAVRRFWIVCIGYIAWVILAIALMGPLLDAAHRADLPGWVAPVIFVLAIAVPLPIMNGFFYSKPAWIKEVQRTGKLAPAQVLKAEDTHTSMGNGSGRGYYFDLTLRVTPQGEAAFEVKTEVLDFLSNIPSAGDAVVVRYDPADRRHIMLAPDAGVASPPHRPAAHHSASTTGVSGGHAGNLADQLGELEALHRSGALTDQEFELAKKKLLAG